MHNFRKLSVWQKSVALTTQIYKWLNEFPKEERYNLVSQIMRAAVSVPANIAEGSAKLSDKDFSRFLQISLGSLYELETELLIACNLSFITTQQYDSFIKEIVSLEKMILVLVAKFQDADKNSTTH